MSDSYFPFPGAPAPEPIGSQRRFGNPLSVLHASAGCRLPAASDCLFECVAYKSPILPKVAPMADDSTAPLYQNKYRGAVIFCAAA